MKVSKQQAGENRDAILQAAAALLRGRGFAQMSVTDVAHAAGLTHGALYSHFASKDALQAEATRRAFADCHADFSGLTAPALVARYLSAAHRDDAAQGCPTAALVSDMRLQPPPCKTAFRDGFAGFIDLTAASLASSGARHDRDRAIFVFAAMVGGLAIARAIHAVDQAGSDTILRALAQQLAPLIAAPRAVKPRRAAKAAKPAKSGRKP